MNYVRETQLNWPLLIDESCELYRAYGMERESNWNVFGPASWGTYIRLLLKGRKLRKPSGDLNQIGGDVLVDPQGIVRLHYVSRNPADRPEVDAILTAVGLNLTE